MDAPTPYAFLVALMTGATSLLCASSGELANGFLSGYEPHSSPLSQEKYESSANGTLFNELVKDPDFHGLRHRSLKIPAGDSPGLQAWAGPARGGTEGNN